jgi:hypothetical protein
MPLCRMITGALEPRSTRTPASARRSRPHRRGRRRTPRPPPTGPPGAGSRQRPVRCARADDETVDREPDAGRGAHTQLFAGPVVRMQREARAEDGERSESPGKW